MLDKFMNWILFDEYSVIILIVISSIFYGIVTQAKKTEKAKQSEIEQDKLAKKIAKEMLLAQNKEKEKK